MESSHVSRTIRASLLLPPLAAALLACSGGGSGGPPPGTAPEIASLYVWPADALLNQGGGAVSVSYGLLVTDPDADVARLVVTVRDAAEEQVSQRTEPITNPPGETSRTIGGYVALPTTAMGTYTLEVQAFDARGAGSNLLRGTFAVVPAHPVPAIVALSPETAPAGGAAFALTVTGSGFTQGSTVRWNGYALSTTYVDAGTLRAQVESYRLTYAGAAEITVATPLPGGGTSGAATFVVGPPVPSPVPTLTSLSPASADAGGPSFKLIASGTGFVPSSRVVWDGSHLSTTFVDASTLEATVSTYDAATPRAVGVSVYTPAPGGGTSASRTFEVTRPAQPGVRFVSLKANDLVWDPYRRRIYVSVPALSPVAPNTVTELDPFTGELTASRHVGSDPDRIDLSDDGGFLYVGLRGASSVERLTLPDLLQDLSIAMDRDPTYGAQYAGDVRVAPASPRTFAVSLFYAGSTTSGGGGLVVYDDGIPRPVRAAGSPASYNRFDSLQWGGTAGELYATGASYGYDLYAFAVDASGVVLADTYRSSFSTAPATIRFDAGTRLVYAEDGRAVDPATGLLAGTFPVAGYGRRMVPDSSLGSAFFVSGESYSTTHAVVGAYDLAHYYPTSSTTVAFAGSSPRRLIRWGADGLAFLAADHVVLVRGPAVLPVSTASNPVPALTALAPSTVGAGGPNLALAVSGAGFVRGSTVLWNGGERSTRFVSPTELIAYVPASDVAAAGTASVTVASPAPGGGASTAATFTVAP